MDLNSTPRGNRIHIGIFGKRNAGKSSLINALTGQNLAIVSDAPGTTTDPVFKSMELHPIGPVVFIDTAGFDDRGELGGLRLAKTQDMIRRTDLAILVVDGTELAGSQGRGGKPMLEDEAAWARKLVELEVPVILAVNKADLLTKAERQAAMEAAGKFAMTSGLQGMRVSGDTPAAGLDGATGRSDVPAGSQGMPVLVSAATEDGMEELRLAIQNAVEMASSRSSDGNRPLGDLLGGMVGADALVLLVMPQDIQAPKGRLILPQVQTIRELLDRKCTVVSTTADGFERSLRALRRAPDLVITDSQCFRQIYEKKPEESPLTSFSILMAAAKGDLQEFIKGAEAIDRAGDVYRSSPVITASMTDRWDADGSQERQSGTDAVFRVLIAEACTHVPLNEDIGTVKIPGLLKQTLGDRVNITSVRGNDFPQTKELKQYDLIIHCGACMFNRSHVMSRVAAAQEAGVPITNYGVVLAKMAGILDKISLPAPGGSPLL